MRKNEWMNDDENNYDDNIKLSEKKIESKRENLWDNDDEIFDSETTRSTFWIVDVDVDVCVCVHVLIIWDGIIIDHCGISLFID